MTGAGLAGLAAAAGVASALNPCGIGLLPAYIGHLATRFGARRPLRHAIVASALMASSFLVVFTLLGLFIRAVGGALFRLAPPVALAVAALLAAVGVLTLVGRRPAWTLPLWQVEGRGYAGAILAYGFSFAFCSMGCTLPVFLAIALQATAYGAGVALAAFSLYAVAMGLVLLPISLAAVLAADRLHRLLSPVNLERVERASGLLMLASAGYLAWYWTIGPEHLVRLGLWSA